MHLQKNALPGHYACKKLSNKQGKRARLFACEERDEPKMANLSHERQYCAVVSNHWQRVKEQAVGIANT
jgi:hypothetical protein